MATKLLVIDDDANICDLLKIYFENEIKIKESYQLNNIIESKSHDNEGNIYYHSCYTPNGKLLKLNISEKTVKDRKISLFAVIHNLLIRTKTIAKTDYLAKMNLTDQEFNMVYYFQIIILNAIKSGEFILNQKNKIAFRNFFVFCNIYI